MKTIRYKSPQYKRWLRQLTERRSSLEAEARDAAEVIIGEVRAEGDRAVARSVRKFDHGVLRPNELLDRLSGSPQISKEASKAIDDVIARVRRFHEKQKAVGYDVSENGATFGHRVVPLDRVGLYIPGGRAIHLTTLIMCAVPAHLAGVREIVVATPLQASKSAEFRAICQRLGIGEIYRAGGPAAIAAMAVGTQSLRRVSKIVGPGNRFVCAAKAILSGEVGIDMITGGGEVVVVADETADVSRIASDLLAQAERGDDNLIVCVAVADDVARAITNEVAQLRRVRGSGNTARILDRDGVVIRVSSDKEAVQLVNRIGPQRVSLMTRNASELVEHISCTAAIFVGSSSMLTAGALGAGPNEVLPTGGTAEFFSPLGVYDFYRRYNVIELSEELIDTLEPTATLLAELEELPHHAAALEKRTSKA